MPQSNDDDRYTGDRPGAPRRRRRPAQPAEVEPVNEEPRTARPRKGGSVLLWVALGLTALFAVLLTCCGGVGALVYYTPGGVRDTADRAKSSNNLKQIGLALHTHHDVRGSFPPPSLKTRTGKPGLSWRVAILPYIEQDYLYRQFKLDEPWDSPANLALLNQVPPTYMIPGQTDQTVTHYRGFVGPGTMFDPTPNRQPIRFANI